MSKPRTPIAVADPEARWEAIRARLEAHADILADQGGLVPKDARGRRVWAVRFVDGKGGRRVHRSIYVGDETAVIVRTQALLDEYRLRVQWAGEVDGYARIAARAGAIA